MSLLKSIANALRGATEAAANQLQDPVRDGKFAIEDAKKQKDAFVSQIASLVAGTKALEKRVANENAEVQKFENIAQRAGAANDADGVREALALKAKNQKEADAFQHEIDQNKALEAKLRAQLDDMNARIENAETDSVRLGVRVESSKLRTEVAKGAAGVSGGDGLAALDELSKAADDSDAQAEAWEEMAKTNAHASGSDLSAKYGDGTKGAVSDDDVAKYLKK